MVTTTCIRYWVTRDGRLSLTARTSHRFDVQRSRPTPELSALSRRQFSHHLQKFGRETIFARPIQERSFLQLPSFDWTYANKIKDIGRAEGTRQVFLPLSEGCF